MWFRVLNELQYEVIWYEKRDVGHKKLLTLE